VRTSKDISKHRRREGRIDQKRRNKEGGQGRRGQMRREDREEKVR
jgi:hypothetical protein